MKYALFFLVCLLSINRTHAQVKSTDQVEKTVLKVLLTKGAMTVTYLDKPLPIKNVQQLDSLFKVIPVPEHSRIEFESENADRDQSITIIRSLEKCNCHLVTKSRAVMDK
ncbi:MAG: hypothetical protein JST68_20150 [Bacteroidetes bacterium]|nr:hypothetical protein [Bacteroidota bacterium]